MDYPVVTPAQLALHLRSLRKTRQLTQAELGAKLGVNQARVGKIERDPSGVSVGQLMQMLGLLGVRLVLKDATAPTGAAPHRAQRATW
jgi:HTH-type transcriptional regulator / antitoxin HipB